MDKFHTTTGELGFVNRKLWEGESNAFAIEGGINGLVDVEEDTPVILFLNPRTHRDVYAAIGQGRKGDERSRIVQD